MIEYSYVSRVGEFPLFFHVTDAPVGDVEAVLVDPAGARHDMIEFEETAPDEHGRWGRRVGARVPTPFWATGAYVVEWTVSGTVEARYAVTVKPHRTQVVNGQVQLKFNHDELARFAQLPREDQEALKAALLPKKEG